MINIIRAREDAACQRLAIAIIFQAVKHWKTRRGIKYRTRWHDKAGLIAFFNSRWFEFLLAGATDIDKDMMLKELGVPIVES